MGVLQPMPRLKRLSQEVRWRGTWVVQFRHLHQLNIMSPSSADWHVLLSGILLLIPAWFQSGLVRVGITLWALSTALGVVVRLTGGSFELRYALTGLGYLGAAVIAVGAVRQRRMSRRHLTDAR